MAVADTKANFLREPWIARQLEQPNIVVAVPGSRTAKSSTEDNLTGQTLKGPGAIQSCIFFYKDTTSPDGHIAEVSTAMQIGERMNGHPHILHGGIVATIIDESMGIYKSANHKRGEPSASEGAGKSKSQAPNFTAELKIKFLKPVYTPTTILITARHVKKDGRKEWINAELKQCIPKEGSTEGEVITCALGEALFIEARSGKI